MYSFSGLKSLVFFVVFYTTSISLATLRMDLYTGHETLNWLEKAHEQSGRSSLGEVQEVSDVSAYLDDSLAEVVGELKHICTNCDVAITPRSQDLTFLSLEDFVCSDFDSKDGSSSYPARDCATEDALWASSPSSTTAPCCQNASLVTASVAMMTEALAYGITSLPLSTLLAGGTDPSYSSTEYFVQYYLEHNRFMMQLIISRAQRFAAVEYRAAPMRADAPMHVEPILTYWSFNYANMRTQQLLLALMLFSAVLTLHHGFRQALWVIGPTLDSDSDALPALRDRLTKLQAEARSFGRLVRIMILQGSWYGYVIEVPSIILPLLLELVRPFMELPTWIFWVACTEMVLSVRLLHEGTVAPPLKRLVRIIDEATPNMVALVVVLVPIAALTSLMHSQLFGLFDDGYSDPWVALSRVVSMLTAPPPKENSEGDAISAQRTGAEVLFYWSTIVIRLCFGSFIVAILVGALNKVISNEQQEGVLRRRDTSLPPDYANAGDRSLCGRATVFGTYVVLSSFYGMRGPDLVKQLESQVAVMEAADRTGNATKEQLMARHEQLVELVGPRTAQQLLEAHGARRLHGEEVYNA